MTARARLPRWAEPLCLLAAGLVGSAALWGRLWVTSPSTRGVCGCGDPSLFQWFLAWPAHALSTGHSLVFSRDLFYPYGINLLSNTSVLLLGVVLAPVTWLGGPVLTQNLALLASVPVAVVGMDLLLRRLTDSVAARIVCSLLYGFSPYVLSSLTVSHLMTAWIGLLPLMVLGGYDAMSEDPRRSRRGQALLAATVVAEFFISTELLALAVIVACVVAVVTGATWLVTRTPADAPSRVARRLGVPLAAAAAVLAIPAAYALFGPRSLKGNIWGVGFNPSTGGSSIADLLRPHAVRGGLTALSGYSGPAMVQMQYLGFGLVGVAACLAVWRWRDAVSRTAGLAALACLVLCLSPRYASWAPWQWLGRLPVLENVLQFRFAVFALLGALIVVARGAGGLESLGRAGVAAAAVALAVVAVPIVVPEAQGLPLRTAHVATPAWWRAAGGPAVVLAYPYPGVLLQSPLTWQSTSSFAVSMLGGSGPQGALSRAGADATATAVLNGLSARFAGRPTASAATITPVRSMVERHGVSDVVVPAHLRGRWLVTGAAPRGAVAFFIQALGILPVVERGAWVFTVHGPLPAARLASRPSLRRCAGIRAPAAFAQCVFAAGR